MKSYYSKPLLGALTLLSLSACSADRLRVTSVDYQSVRTEYAQPTEIPSDARITATYFINGEGELIVIVKNLTDEIITIDQTRSFFTGPDGISTSYYDPNVKASSETQFESSTGGISLGLGAVANALGVGGRFGTLLGGIGLNSSSTTGSAQTQTTYFKDMPQVSLAPKSQGIMSKQFRIKGIGESVPYSGNFDRSFSDSPIKFSFHLSYSFDNGLTYERLSTNFYVNTSISVPVKEKHINNAFRGIYNLKRDALAEPAFIFKIHTNINSPQAGTPVYDAYTYGGLVDFK